MNLKFGECYLVLTEKNDGTIGIVNSFFPYNREYSENRLTKLLADAKHAMRNWNDNYFRDLHQRVYLMVGEEGSIRGDFNILREI